MKIRAILGIFKFSISGLTIHPIMVPLRIFFNWSSLKKTKTYRNKEEQDPFLSAPNAVVACCSRFSMPCIKHDSYSIVVVVQRESASCSLALLPILLRFSTHLARQTGAKLSPQTFANLCCIVAASIGGDGVDKCKC
uniref:Uncharacterized protein n=1 Tax=Glossina brevipalpis TaxID=37001 RepID=A0A1A9WXA4_9MUSC